MEDLSLNCRRAYTPIAALEILAAGRAPRDCFPFCRDGSAAVRFMTSYIKFTPISGAKNEDALCYLLEIDEVKILLDCGWSDNFDVDDLVNLKK